MGLVMGERRRSLRLRVATDGRGIGVVHLYGTPEGVPCYESFPTSREARKAVERSRKQITFDFPFARHPASAKAGQALTAKAVRNDKRKRFSGARDQSVHRCV